MAIEIWKDITGFEGFYQVSNYSFGNINQTKSNDKQREFRAASRGNNEILPELEGEEQIFTKRSNGKWIAEGQLSKDGVRLALHYQRHYINPEY